MKYISNNYFLNSAAILILTLAMVTLASQSTIAQSRDSGIAPLRSDVGINGLTVNHHGLAKFTNLSNKPPKFDGSSELEVVFRDVRMMSQRIGLGFQAMASFFTDGPNDGKSFGIGSWGIGPVVRAYPFKTNRFQPYVQANSLVGNNLGLGKLANMSNRGNGFRIRLGLRGGVAYRLSDSFGIFVEGGYDWESGALFKADARTLQLNIGIDLYRFN
ncbi:MAG TPA: hypothetical protein VK112_04865 [Fodinibius sp.]|nr:hypothetical protein [Fodinibius sp.]